MHAPPRLPRVATSLFLALSFAACSGDGPTAPKVASVRAVAGGGATDSVDTQLIQALVVEVRGSDGGLANGVLVRFEAQPPATNPGQYFQPAVYVCPLDATDCGGPYGGGAQTLLGTTNAQGRALVMVRLGHVAGRGVVKMVVPEFGVQDSVTYNVTPGQPKRVIAQVADTMLDIGGKATLRGRVVDRYDNPRTEATTLTAGPGTVFMLDAASGTVTGRDMGTQWLFTRYGTLADSTRVSVVPAGRLAVWSSLERVVRLVNLNGTDERTIISSVSSSMGAFPRFDPTRQRVTLHAGDAAFGEPQGNVIVVDTTGSPRRDVGAQSFDIVIATRQLADGSVLVVAPRSVDVSHPGYSLWRVATDNTITFVVAMPDMGTTYGGADISHSGSKVAYVALPQSGGAELRVLDVLSGATTVLDPIYTSTPRWSALDDKVAYLVPTNVSPAYAGVVTIVNANGTGRRTIGNFDFSPGISWSPDGTYIVGRASDNVSGLRVVRLSDGASITLRYGGASLGYWRDYWQPDWR